MQLWCRRRCTVKRARLKAACLLRADSGSQIAPSNAGVVKRIGFRRILFRLYYKALRRTQTTLRNETPDWEPRIGFFLRCLKKQKDSLAARLDRERIAKIDEAVLPLLHSESAAGERA